MADHPPLGTRALNRAVLARQHLLSRTTADVPAVLRDMAGLQAKYAPAMYVGLWNRRRDLDRDDLTGLLADRTVAQGTLMRGTIHLVAAADYWPVALGLRQPGQPRRHRPLGGVPVGVIAPACERLGPRRFRDGSGTTPLDLPDAPLPDPDTPAPVRLLPVWDATLLVHARRALVLPEAYRSRVFHVRNPQSVNTVPVDGTVAGTWRHAGGRIEVEQFHPLSTAVRREVAAEAERLAALYA
jgi:hypothetical protein